MTTHSDRVSISLSNGGIAFQWLKTKLIVAATDALINTLASHIKTGQLRIVTKTHILTFPSPAELQDKNSVKARAPESQETALNAQLFVRDDIFWLRLLSFGDLGFADAYMLGEVECDNLVDVLKIYIANRTSLEDLTRIKHYLSYLPSFLKASTLMGLVVASGDVKNAQSNISAHYDLSNEMFQAFLSADMTYSCGIFQDVDEDLRETSDTKSISTGLDPLEEAQVRKLMNILNKADIRDGHHVLEIGTGWGSFAILAATQRKCTVESITLSEEQAALARQRIKAAGLSDRINVHVRDYRCLPEEWKGLFHRFVSIEMMEHVGPKYMEEYWNVVDWALNANGAGCIQATTLPEARIEQYSRGCDFIQKYIFPGCFIPSVSMLTESMHSATRGALVVESIENIARHYPRTLREWRRRFERNFDDKIWPELRTRHGLTHEEGQQFKRKWIYYFCYCEAGFATRILGCHAIAFTREGNVGLYSR